MPEVIIKYKNTKALQALKDLAKYFDISIGKSPPATKKTGVQNKKNGLPISFAKDPNVAALSGVWKGRNITLETLRKKAWGNRL